MEINHTPTEEEVLLKTALEKRGLRVLSQVPDGHKFIDLAIPSARINIEVDGIQHLTDSYQIVRDLKREHYSDDLGYDTIHIQNLFIRNNLEQIADSLYGAAHYRAQKIKYHSQI